MQDEMLTYVKSALGKYCKEGDNELSKKKDAQLVTMFRRHFDEEMSKFPLSLKYGDVINPVTFQVAILFAVQIRSLFPPEEQLSRDVLLYDLLRIFTGCVSHREAINVDKEHKAGKLPHNHIFFELIVVACGSMIDTFVQLEYLIISEHKSGGKTVQVNPQYTNGEGFMILPTYKYLIKTHNLPSRPVSPDQVMSNLNTSSLLPLPPRDNVPTLTSARVNGGSKTARTTHKFIQPPNIGS
jgi:hypothetical protein